MGQRCGWGSAGFMGHAYEGRCSRRTRIEFDGNERTFAVRTAGAGEGLDAEFCGSCSEHGREAEESVVLHGGWSEIGSRRRARSKLIDWGLGLDMVVARSVLL